MSTPQGLAQIMDDFNSETDSDYTSYWRDWVSWNFSSSFKLPEPLFFEAQRVQRPREASCKSYDLGERKQAWAAQPSSAR
jgi:hypothetical protein